MDYKEKYQDALLAYQDQRDQFKTWQDQYDGKMQPAKGRETETLFNFSKELIESQIDNSVPSPKVEPNHPSEKNKQLALIIEQMLRAEAKRLRLKEENDEDERTTKIHGGNLRLIEWDNTLKTHSTVGATNSLLIHPLQYVPQEGIYNQKLMDYQFVTFEKTKDRIKAQYGKDVQKEGTDPQTSPSDAEDIVTQVICYYRNSKGTIGVYSWVGDTVLIDDNEYNARGKTVCTKCNRTKQSSVCECGNKKFEKRNLDYEELTDDIETLFGVIPSMSTALDEDGNPKLMEISQEVTEFDEFGNLVPLMEQVFDEKMNAIGERPALKTFNVPYEEPTKIPYYVPKTFPLVIRHNVSKFQNILGDSDCEVIRPAQDIANKISTKMTAKLIKAGSYLTKPRNLNFNFTSADVGESQIIELNDPSEMTMIKAVEMKFESEKDVSVINQLYYWAKSLLGVNDTSQGKADPTALSGKAKEIQVARALGRQESKIEMKNAFYANCYRVMFEYMLAYADEPRKYRLESDEGDDEVVTFNRYDFLEQDEHGNWYYNDEFSFSVDNEGNTQENRQYILSLMEKDLLQGLYGNAQDPETMLSFWKDREALNYPNAKRQVARWQRKVEAMKEMQEISAKIGAIGSPIGNPMEQEENYEMPQL